MTARVIVGMSGASGAAIGLRVIELLAQHGHEIHLVISPAAERTLEAEVEASDRATLDEPGLMYHRHDDIGASIASGSVPIHGMIVAPCSMRTLGSIANTLSDNLLVRAADVQLKERRPLILVARETPLHLGHLRNMTAVTEMGAIVMPPVPAFYLRPSNIGEVVDQIARRAIDLLHVAPPLARSWAGTPVKS